MKKAATSFAMSTADEDTSDWDTQLAEWYVQQRCGASSKLRQGKRPSQRFLRRKEGDGPEGPHSGPNQPGRLHALHSPQLQDVPELPLPEDAVSAQGIHVVETETLQNGKEPRIKRFACSACQQHFSTEYLTKLHINSKHLMLALYRCTVCGEAFCTPRRRRRHFMLKHYENTSPLLCATVGCNRSFSNPVLLAEHRATTHRRITTQKGATLVPFTCELCGLSGFSHRVRLEKHILTCHSVRDGQGAFVCDHGGCNHRSPSYSAFRRHLARHKDVSQQFECDREACNARFAVYEMLLEHKRLVHPKPSLLRCVDCNKIFVTRTGLQRHYQNRHIAPPSNRSPRKSSICPLDACGKRFSTLFNLRDHLIHFHLQLKTYRCNLCNAKSFTSRNAAARHVKQLHPTKHNQAIDASGRDTGAPIFETVYTMEAIRGEAAVARVCTALQKGVLSETIVLNPGGSGIQIGNPHVLESVAMVAEDASLDAQRIKRFQTTRHLPHGTSEGSVLDPVNDENEIVIWVENTETELEEESSTSNTDGVNCRVSKKIVLPPMGKSFLQVGRNDGLKSKGFQQNDLSATVHSERSRTSTSSPASVTEEPFSVKEKPKNSALIAETRSLEKEACALNGCILASRNHRSLMLAENNQAKKSPCVRGSNFETQGTHSTTDAQRPSPQFSYRSKQHHTLCGASNVFSAAVSHTERKTRSFGIPCTRWISRTVEDPSQGVQSIPVAVVSIKNRRIPSKVNLLHRREKKRSKC